ncbi:hypothetical protein GGS21DRAFT_492605 [Xylaria nigripes]|nr:hypothetical protein GGS21DRAFT_492605 [Xylaria nigripes]
MDVSVPENNKLLNGNLQYLIDCPKPEKWFTSSKDKQRDLQGQNRLQRPETFLEDIVNEEDYWLAVTTRIAPPRKWADPVRLFRYLAQIRPLDQPSNAKIWVNGKKWLNSAIKQGESTNWKGNINPGKGDAEFWEALRISGCSKDGYGSWPDIIRKQINEAGFDWISVKPSKRIVPQCWSRWATENGVPFASTRTTDVYNNTSEQNQEGISGTSDAATQTNDTLIKVTRNFVEQGIDTDEALRSLISQVMSQEPSSIERVPFKPLPPNANRSDLVTTMQQNHDALASQNITMYNEAVDISKSLVTRIFQSAVQEGLVEAIVRQTMANAMENVYEEMKRRLERRQNRSLINITHRVDMKYEMLRQRIENIEDVIESDEDGGGEETRKTDRNYQYVPDEDISSDDM